MSNPLIDALKLKWQGEVAIAKANIDNLLNNANGVADHPDMAQTLDSLVKQLASAQEQLSTLQKLEYDPEFLQD